MKGFYGPTDNLSNRGGVHSRSSIWVRVVEVSEGEIMADDIVLGAKQLKNPKGIKSQLDTDEPKRKPITRKGYMNTDTYHPGDSGMNTENTPGNTFTPEPKKHPIDEWFGRGIKRSNGLLVPNDHPAVQQSDN